MYFVEKTKGFNVLKNFDYYLFFAVILLTGIGMLVLYSATLHKQDGTSYLLKQTVGIVIGILCCIIISVIDYKDFKVLGYIFYFGSITLLVLVLFIGIGYTQTGTNGWINLGGFNFQPSELAKIASVVVAAIYFEKIYDKDKNPGIIKLLFFSVLPVILVLLQPDTGTAMVFMFAFFIMSFTCRLKYRYILIGIGMFLASLPILWFKVLVHHQKDRIISFINPEAYAQGIGYHVVQSKRAIGSGQIFGLGLFEGIQTQNGAVPEQHTDFIFSVIGEELGFIGTTIIILLIFFILLRCIFIAKNSRDSYGAFLVIGLTAVLMFHFIENIGMTIGILPITGIPLPFVSYGGSAMITNFIAIGIILSVSSRRKKTIFNICQ